MDALLIVFESFDGITCTIYIQDSQLFYTNYDKDRCMLWSTLSENLYENIHVKQIIPIEPNVQLELINRYYPANTVLEGLVI